MRTSPISRTFVLSLLIIISHLRIHYIYIRSVPEFALNSYGDQSLHDDLRDVVCVAPKNVFETSRSDDFWAPGAGRGQVRYTQAGWDFDDGKRFTFGG